MAWWRGDPRLADVYVARLRQIVARYPDHGPAFEGWRYPDDWDMDLMFFADRLPPVFRQALALTGHAFEQFARRGERDGLALLALATSGLSSGPDGAEASSRHDNPVRARLQLERIAGLLGERGIPLIDQRAHIEAHGGDPRDGSFAHDGHWSPQGHRWAAEALLAWLVDHPAACRSRGAAASGGG